MFRAITATAIFALSITAAAIPARAESADAIPVAFGDLNLSNPADAKILADRLQIAARQVCITDNANTGRIGKALVQECMDSAVALATAEIEDKVENGANRQLHANLISVREQVSLN